MKSNKRPQVKRRKHFPDTLYVVLHQEADGSLYFEAYGGLEAVQESVAPGTEVGVYRLDDLRKLRCTIDLV